MTERMTDERYGFFYARCVGGRDDSIEHELFAALEAERHKLTALTPHIYDAAMRLSHKSSGQSANETAFELVRILEGRRAENDD